MKRINLNKLKIRKILGGLKSYLPNSISYSKGVGGANEAPFCYMQGLKIISLLKKYELETNPHKIIEFGPGNSMGAGFTLLICGANQYTGLDAVRHVVNTTEHLKIFDELVKLCENKSPIPGRDKYPKTYSINEKVDDFPQDVLTDERLLTCLDKNRINSLRKEIELMNITYENKVDDSAINYMSPWQNSFEMQKESMDLIYSFGVLQSVDNLESTYKSMYKWMKKNAVMIHSMDFRNLGLSQEWNGHWQYADLTWKLIRGNRPYLINREPLSTHVNLLKKIGFTVVDIIKKDTFNFDEHVGSIERKRLAPKFKNMSDEDFTTTSATIIATK
jgi:hypothetical protein